MRTITFDLEIEKDPTSLPGGWGACRTGEAGISAIVLHDSMTGRFHIYDRNRIMEAGAHLAQADRWVSYNGRDFDVPVIEAFTGPISPTLEHVDLLQVIWKALGSNRTGHPKGTWGLSKVCERTLGLQKNANGEFATKLFAEGRFGELFDYCLNDVHLTHRLYEHITRVGYVVGPDNIVLPVAPPEHLEAA